MKLLTEFETLEAAHAGRSISRFGDGELKLATGRDAKSQRHVPALEDRLRVILKSPNAGPLVCIPAANKFSPKFDLWTTFDRPLYTKLYNSGGTYGSPFITRPDSAPWIDVPTYWDRVIDLWRGRDVVLVRGPNKSLTPEDLAQAASVAEIMGPAQHAFSEADALYAQLKTEKSRRVIFCLGATATVLCFRLGLAGVHAIDLGHIGMFMRRDPFALGKMRK